MIHVLVSGGGALAGDAPRRLDRLGVARVSDADPTALLLPTAGGDDPAVRDAFHVVYGDALGCETDVLCLTAEEPPADAVERVQAADLVHVSGGDTRRMLATWRGHGLLGPLRRVAADGTLVTGVSAGAICWFAAGFSDAVPDREYAFMSGLGLWPDLVVCPHAHGESRRARFRDALATTMPTRTGFALPDGALLEVRDDRYRFHLPPDGTAYVVSPEGETTRVTPEHETAREYGRLGDIRPTV